MKLLWLLALATIACKMFAGRWPWEWLASSTKAQAQTRARVLLGVGRNARRDEIIDAHRRLIAMVHPDRGGTNEQVHEANAARDVLLAAQLPES
jgi:DnaJ family protein C protein 19